MGERKKRAAPEQFLFQEYDFIRGAEVEGEMESYTLVTAVLETDIMELNEESQNEQQVEDASDDDSEHSYTFSSFGNRNFQPCIYS